MKTGMRVEIKNKNNKKSDVKRSPNRKRREERERGRVQNINKAIANKESAGSRRKWDREVIPNNKIHFRLVSRRNKKQSNRDLL